MKEEQIQMRKAVIQNRMALDILTAAKWGTCTIIKAKHCLYIPDLSGNVPTALADMQNQVKAMSNENIPFWTLLLSWVQRLVENYCYCCHNRSNHTALWTLLLTKSCEFCNPGVDSVLSCEWPKG